MKAARFRRARPNRSGSCPGLADAVLRGVPHLTDQDLKDIGVPLGPRRKILAAITAETGTTNATPEPAASIEPKAQDTAERRQVTVMFSDLVGSTALSARMDPEDLREVISAYQKCVAETMQRFGGFVAKYARLRSDTPPRTAMQQIADWLQKLGLGQYAQRFAENEIDVSVHTADAGGRPDASRSSVIAARIEPGRATSSTAQSALNPVFPMLRGLGRSERSGHIGL